jgi:hypothetical protein
MKGQAQRPNWATPNLIILVGLAVAMHYQLCSLTEYMTGSLVAVSFFFFVFLPHEGLTGFVKFCALHAIIFFAVLSFYASSKMSRALRWATAAGEMGIEWTRYLLKK